jgi:threonine/homoserine efflux transporter RhtA
MTTSVRVHDFPATGSAGRGERLTGIALMTGSAASNQLGAATAALAFPVLGPAGVVAVRQWVAGAVLLATVRPRFTSFTREQWRPVLALALIFATMNLSLYLAIDRIGLGLAVTLEFLGPLSVALLASRHVLDLGCALVAGGAVVVLARPQPSTDYAGLGLAVVARRVLGRIHPGELVVADLVALRWVSARFFGVLMRREPGLRGADRPGGAGPVAGLAGLARDGRDRDRQRGEHQHGRREHGRARVTEAVLGCWVP